MDLAKLPTITETPRQMLGLIDQVRAAVSQAVPAAAPWRWNRQFASSDCPGGDTPGGVILLFPNPVSGPQMTDPEWAEIFPEAQRLAADAGLVDLPMMQNSAGNHDARFSSPDGRVLTPGARVATVITAQIGCRRSGAESLWVGDNTALPPDPQP